MVKDSKSRLECLETEHLLLLSILDHNNIDLESKTTTHTIKNNGSSSTGEQELLDLLPTLDKLSPSNKEEETGTTTTTPLLLDNSEVSGSKRSDGSMEVEETSEMSVLDASMFTETPTLTEDTFTGTSATMVQTKPGTSTKEDTTIQSNHLLLELSSKSSQECTETELCSTMNTSEDINTELESKTTIHPTENNGGPST